MKAENNPHRDQQPKRQKKDFVSSPSGLCIKSWREGGGKMADQGVPRVSYPLTKRASVIVSDI